MEIALIIIAFVIGIIVAYSLCKPKMKVVEKQNTAIADSNKQLEEEHIKLLTDNKEIYNALKEIENLVVKKQEEKAKLDGQIDVITSSIEDMSLQAEKSAEAIRESAMAVMQASLDKSAEELANNFQQAEEEHKQQYLQSMADLMEDFNKAMEERRNQLAAASSALAELTNKVQAAVAANIREQEKKEQTSFYTLGISEIDIREVKKIREVIPYLRNGRPISKAIWECYYRNLATDLINRIVGPGTHTGIYRITCLLDNKTYIGQARDIGDRWKTHIKCGLGIDTPANKLYTAMLQQGVENFTFEVIEECAAADLNKQEKYWIDFYQSNIYGYNMTSGGSRSN